MFKEVNELAETFNVAETTLISRIQEDEEFTGNIAERLLLKYIYRVSLNYFYFSKQKNVEVSCVWNLIIVRESMKFGKNLTHIPSFY